MCGAGIRSRRTTLLVTNRGCTAAIQKTVSTVQLSAAFRESGADAMIAAIEAAPDRFPPLAKLIARVAPNSPADQFGINTGCLIVRVDDTPFEPMGSLIRKNNPYAIPAELHLHETAKPVEPPSVLAAKMKRRSFLQSGRSEKT